MGLSAYGSDTYLQEVWKFVKIISPDRLVIQLDNYEIDEFVLGVMCGKKGAELFQVRANLAYAVQTILEECILSFLRHLYEKTRCPRLSIAGGVALNSITNGKIFKNTPFKSNQVLEILEPL